MALSYGAIDVKEAIAASRVEEESQVGFFILNVGNYNF